MEKLDPRAIYVPRKALVNVSWLNISQRWQYGHQGQQNHFRRQYDSVTGKATVASQGEQSSGTASQATGPEPNRRSFPGSPGERADSGEEPPPAEWTEVRSRISWVTVGRLCGHESSVDLCDNPALAALGCSTACAPRRRFRRAGGWRRPRRPPVYLASARTRGGTAPFILWVPVIGG